MAADVRAHVAVAQAVASGRLPALSSWACADCAGKAAIYHHESYAPECWLDVVPLCARCHRARHRTRRGDGTRANGRVPIAIRFKPETAEALKALAEEEHRSINGTVLEAVERYIRSRRRQPKDAQDGR